MTTHTMNASNSRVATRPWVCNEQRVTNRECHEAAPVFRVHAAAKPCDASFPEALRARRFSFARHYKFFEVQYPLEPQD